MPQLSCTGSWAGAGRNLGAEPATGGCSQLLTICLQPRQPSPALSPSALPSSSGRAVRRGTAEAVPPLVFPSPQALPASQPQLRQTLSPSLTAQSSVANPSGIWRAQEEGWITNRSIGALLILDLKTPFPFLGQLPAWKPRSCSPVLLPATSSLTSGRVHRAFPKHTASGILAF